MWVQERHPNGAIALSAKKTNPNYVIVKKNGVFIASCPDLDLAVEGATEQEALSNLEEALALFFEDLPGPADG
jgi:predicted RNase H-like HicB family nuclease